MKKKAAPFEVGACIGDWTVIAQVEQQLESPRPNGQRVVQRSRVRCVCGTEKTHDNGYLRSGRSTGCGCRRGRALAYSRATHGKSRTPMYRLWACIKHRLKHQPSYAGIRMCEEWANEFTKFEAYIESLGPKPSPQHTLDRKDPNGHYEPGNVRWADKTTQSVNRRNSMLRGITERSLVKVGEKYDRLTVLEVFVERRYDRNWYSARVQCDCGTIKTVYQKQLLSEKTKSCGCYKNRNLLLGSKAQEKPIEANGKSQSLRAWAREKGVSPQVIWNRIYKLRWDPQQAINEPVREGELLEVNGDTRTLAEWEERMGAPVRVIRKRLKLGWTPEKAVSTPVRSWRRQKKHQ